MEFAGKVAIVTGGASGIGQAIATELAENGATAAIADQLEDVGPETARGLESRGFKASFFPVDVSDAAQVESMVKSVVEAYGAVDILVNNAGIGQRCSILEMAVDEWDRVLAVNLKRGFPVFPSRRQGDGETRHRRANHQHRFHRRRKRQGQRSGLLRFQSRHSTVHPGSRPGTWPIRHHRQRSGSGPNGNRLPLAGTSV